MPPTAGDWDYISFESSSIEAQNVWSNVDVAHGGGAYAQLWVRSGAGFSLEDVTLAESGTSCDIRVDQGAALDFQNSVGVQCD